MDGQVPLIRVAASGRRMSHPSVSHSRMSDRAGASWRSGIADDPVAQRRRFDDSAGNDMNDASGRLIGAPQLAGPRLSHQGSANTVEGFRERILAVPVHP